MGGDTVFSSVMSVRHRVTLFLAGLLTAPYSTLEPHIEIQHFPGNCLATHASLAPTRPLTHSPSLLLLHTRSLTPTDLLISTHSSHSFSPFPSHPPPSLSPSSLTHTHSPSLSPSSLTHTLTLTLTPATCVFGGCVGTATQRDCPKLVLRL